jgi:methylmalonyl-CoA/ethylmalonyl-CoA epimerase
MTVVRRLDHVAILVRDSEAAVKFFTSRMGLEVAHAEESEVAGARLTYLDLGNAYLQLIEPTRPEGALMQRLQERGEGLDHVCFGVDDVPAAAVALGDGSGARLGSGRGRVSAFVPGGEPFGVLFETTEFLPAEDGSEGGACLGGGERATAMDGAASDVESDTARRDT